MTQDDRSDSGAQPPRPKPRCRMPDDNGNQHGIKAQAAPEVRAIASRAHQLLPSQ
jgi:hypothetical protein